MSLYRCSEPLDQLESTMQPADGVRGTPISHRATRRLQKKIVRPPLERPRAFVALLVSAVAVGGVAQTPAPRALAAPAPEVEYVYDVMVRRHYNFPNNDAIGYGHGICDKIAQGDSYAQVMSDTKGDVIPNDEFAANYLVSYAVNLLCPGEIWQLRNSAAHYQPPTL